MFLPFRSKQLVWASFDLLLRECKPSRLVSCFSVSPYRTLHNAMPTGDKEAETKRVRIYTKTGDKGKSSLLTGERRPKDDAVFEVLGTIDELNAHIGLAVAHCQCIKTPGFVAKLENIQSTLFDIGAVIASHSTRPDKIRGNLEISNFRFDQSKVNELEKWIDEFEGSLPALRNFILPSGGLASAQLHVTRAVGRRAERRFWTAFQHTLPIIQDLKDQVETLQHIGQYLNRLGDLLFVAARLAAQETGNPEVLYKKPS